MALVLASSRELQISLEPVRVEDRLPSVAFDLLAKLTMPFQEATVQIRECWFTHDALREFECQLSELRSLETGSAALLDMSENAIVRIARNGGNIVITIRASDTMGMSSTVIELNGYSAEISEMLGHLREYEKWW